MITAHQLFLKVFITDHCADQPMREFSELSPALNTLDVRHDLSIQHLVLHIIVSFFIEITYTLDKYPQLSNLHLSVIVSHSCFFFF